MQSKFSKHGCSGGPEVPGLRIHHKSITGKMHKSILYGMGAFQGSGILKYYLVVTA